MSDGGFVLFSGGYRTGGTPTWPDGLNGILNDMSQEDSNY